ncbi:hypothetical protein JYU34_022447 [Plutella xylostella]|uniref:FP protein C-terminal domain-containing protein n=1 Tax=Plutella xylostella TaxID=51655 RepID=A0ABQ7PRH8_PLUXY|nr:hypothetical protein JYU34_022447 [Plutella xylostella]
MLDNTFVKGDMEETNTSDANPSNILEESPPPQFVTTRGKANQNNTSEDAILAFLAEMKREHSEQFGVLSAQISKINEQHTKILEQQAQLEASVNFISSQHDQLKQQVDGLETKLDAKIKLENDENRLYINELEDNIEDLQRKIRSKSIEVRNIPFHKGENLTNMIKTIYQVLSLPFDEHDIKDVYRLPSKDIATKPLILEMDSTNAKAVLLGAIKSYNLHNSQEPLNTKTLGLSGNKTPIYVSDYLTKKAAKLYYLGRMLKRNHNFKFCWSNSGKIFIKKNEESPAIELKHEKQVLLIEQALRRN